MMPTDIGVIDLMIGFPSAEARRHYDFLKTQLRDDESRGMEFPAEYMFKGVPNYVEEGWNVHSFSRDSSRHCQCQGESREHYEQLIQLLKK